jgi:hypothetical protein
LKRVDVVVTGPSRLPRLNSQFAEQWRGRLARALRSSKSDVKIMMREVWQGPEAAKMY